LDQDSTHRISYEEFIKFVTPEEPFSKMLRRILMKREFDFGEQAKKVVVQKGTVDEKKLNFAAHAVQEGVKFN
jgi:hypothetical protein